MFKGHRELLNVMWQLGWESLQDWSGDGFFTENKSSLTTIKKPPYSEALKHKTHHHNYRNSLIGQFLADIIKMVLYSEL